MLRIEKKPIINGREFYDFYIDKTHIGVSEKVKGGWVPIGKRKIVNEEIAARSMIDSMIAKAKYELNIAIKLREQLFKDIK